MKQRPWFFVDCETYGQSPINGLLTEIGVVHFDTRKTFHGVLWERVGLGEKPQLRVRYDFQVAKDLQEWLHKVNGDQHCVFISDNPAWDFMWVAALFDEANMENPFGHSGRRISDFYAGVMLDWRKTQNWKGWRVTPHNHNPVNDAMGNVEAFERIQALVEERKATQ
jgi:hypothetical protein